MQVSTVALFLLKLEFKKIPKKWNVQIGPMLICLLTLQNVAIVVKSTFLHTKFCFSCRIKPKTCWANTITLFYFPLMVSPAECAPFGDTFHAVGLLDWLAVVLCFVCGPSRGKLTCLTWSSHMHMFIYAIKAKFSLVERTHLESVDRIILVILINWCIYQLCDSYIVFFY